MTRLFGGRLVSMGQSLARNIKTFKELLISSPCTAMCSMDANKEFCTGCYRTIDEIMNWSRLSGEKKHQINIAVTQRRSKAGQSGH